VAPPAPEVGLERYPPAAPEVILEIYPLLAKKEELSERVRIDVNDAQLGAKPDPDTRFEIFGSFVYIIVIRGKNEEREWVTEEVAFSIPVKWYKGDDVVNLALVSPYVFVESDNDAIIDREWNGRPTMDATFKSRGTADEPWLTVETDMLPPGGGQVAPGVLLEIVEGDQAAHPSWEKFKKESLDSEAQLPEDFDIAKALALEILCGWRPVKSVMLRQFRDADDPAGPCYQEIMRIARALKLLEIGRFTKAPIVRIHPNASLQIGDILGLIDEKQGGISTCVPIFPFRLSLVSMDETSRKCVYWRAGRDAKWERSPGYDEKADNPDPVLGKAVLDSIKGGEQIPEVLAFIEAKKKDAKTPAPWGGDPVKPEDTVKAVESIPESLAVIISILERGWQHKPPS
jgi:hypothetical protein